MLWWLALLPVFYALYAGALYLAQDKMLFPSDMAGPVSGAFAAPDRYERWPIDLPAGSAPARDTAAPLQVEAWFFPARAATAQTPGPAVVHFHGNAELIDHQEHIVRGYRRMGVSVLLCEFRGYGRSAGKPSQQAVVQDALAWTDRLRNDPRIDPDRIAIHGRSLGASVAQQLAGQRPPQALILETATSDIGSMTLRFGLPPFVLRHRFDGRDLLRNTAAPVLVFQAEQDPIFPPKHGRRIAELAPQSRLVTYDTDHVAFPGDANWSAYWQEIENVLKDAGVLVESAQPLEWQDASADTQPGD